MRFCKCIASFINNECVDCRRKLCVSLGCSLAPPFLILSLFFFSLSVVGNRNRPNHGSGTCQGEYAIANAIQLPVIASRNSKISNQSVSQLTTHLFLFSAQKTLHHGEHGYCSKITKINQFWLAPMITRWRMMVAVVEPLENKCFATRIKLLLLMRWTLLFAQRVAVAVFRFPSTSSKRTTK